MDYLIFGLLLMVGLGLFIHMTRMSKGVENTSDAFTIQYNKCESPIERKVLQALWMNGIQPVAQYPVGSYRLDFAIPTLKIAIECDGKQWHSSPKQKAHDKKRDAYLRGEGWRVLRFSGTLIYNDISKVVRKVYGCMY